MTPFFHLNLRGRGDHCSQQLPPERPAKVSGSSVRVGVRVNKRLSGFSEVITHGVGSCPTFVLDQFMSLEIFTSLHGTFIWIASAKRDVKKQRPRFRGNTGTCASWKRWLIKLGFFNFKQSIMSKDKKKRTFTCKPVAVLLRGILKSADFEWSSTPPLATKHGQLDVNVKPGEGGGGGGNEPHSEAENTNRLRGREKKKINTAQLQLPVNTPKICTKQHLLHPHPPPPTTFPTASRNKHTVKLNTTSYWKQGTHKSKY